MSTDDDSPDRAGSAAPQPAGAAPAAAAPIIEAHRGDSRYAPENTLAAFRQAVGKGAQWIELDVHECADSEFVVMHDTTVDRTTDGTGAIQALTLAQIQRLDAGSWKGPAFGGEPVPILRAVLEWSRDAGVHLNIEIKEMARGLDSAGQLRDMLAGTGSAAGARHVVSSFNLEALLQVQAAGADVELAYLGGTATGPILAQAAAHGLPWVHLQHTGVDAAVMAQARAHQLRTMVWTVDDLESYRHFRQLGVHKICTNDPGTMLLQQRRCRDGR